MASELGVQTIQHTNGTDAMTIDSNGIVKQPVKPAFAVYLEANATGNYTSDTAISFDTKDFDIGNNVTLNNNAVFTAPVDGIYQFNCVLNMDGVTGSNHVSVFFFIDNTHVNSSTDLSYRVIEDPQGGNYIGATNAQLIQLTAGQTVKPMLYVDSDTSSRIRKGTRFSGFLVA